MSTPHTLTEARALLRSGKISPSELLEGFIANIEAAEPQVRAWTVLQLEAARAHAKQLDQQLRPGAELPDLFGIPYGAKDIMCTKGLRTEAGSKVLEGYVPDEDAVIVQKLAAHGAILLGKTTTTEFANLGNPPPTANPWNTAHTPGGSSSGSAAAMAARMALFTLGTQTAGSISRPAAFNGLTALKATFGRISKTGVFPAGRSLDHIGAFTHSAEDAVWFFNAASGPDASDDTTRLLPYQPLQVRRKTDYSIGVLEDTYFDAVAPDALELLNSTLQTLTQLGCKVVRVAAPEGFAALAASQHLTMQAEVANYHADNLRTKGHLFDPNLRDFIAAGLQISATEYLDAQNVRAEYRVRFSELFNQVDMLVTPTALGTAPQGLSATGLPTFNLPFTHLGVPTLALPIGLSPVNGLPLSMQLIAPHLQEQRLIDVGCAFQDSTDWHLRRPPLLDTV